MNTREILKGIRKSLTFYIPIKEPPKWVLGAYDKWAERLSTHPYCVVKHFVGKHYIYKVVHGQGAQGEAPIIGWYKKKRIFAFGKHKWEPKKNIAYRSWMKTPFTRAYERIFSVYIVINKEKLEGSFSVGDKYCEIRAGNYKLIVPKEKVKFSKRIEYFNTITAGPMLGQNGEAGKETIYTAKVLKIEPRDFARFKEFKTRSI